MSVVAIIAAGAMGANVGRKLVEAGNVVLTSLEGRSEATRKRAQEAGMVDASWIEIVERADILLSVIPPKDAVSFAERLLLVQQSAHRLKKEPLVFADCNAVNVVTIKKIAGLFSNTPIAFIDGCIIGWPPSGTSVPTFYGSADPGQEKSLELFKDVIGKSGIKVRILRGEGAGIGDASALKMSYAVSFIERGTMGTGSLISTGHLERINRVVHDNDSGYASTILRGKSVTAIPLAAHGNSPATSAALLEELRDSQPELVGRIKRAVPAMLPKAYRWVGEMEEIAGFVGGEWGNIYHGLAEVYGRVERSEGGEVDILNGFVKAI
jgi:hypothetical protein